MSADTLTDQHTQIRLAARPDKAPGPEHWRVTHDPVAAPQDGEVTVRTQYISLDPAMRGWLNDARSYIPPVQIDEVMRAGGVGDVIASADPNFAVGDMVVGILGVQTAATLTTKGLTKVDTRLAPAERYLGGLGMPGMTAYFGLLEIGQPKEGDTVVVSAAAGAVGALVGQIAKIKGAARVIGIAGGAEKCAYVVNDLGFDACIDYKNEDVRAALKEHCPDRLDVYFDNVGGAILDDVLMRLNRGARIAICGAISNYNDPANMSGPKNYLQLLINRARMEGFVVFDFAPRYGEAVMAMAGWAQEGRLKFREHVVEGIENFPDALAMLFNGANFGKLVLKV